MRDIGVVFGLLCGTIAAGILFYYAWPERTVYPFLKKMLYVIGGCLVFLWISITWMWFSV